MPRTSEPGRSMIWEPATRVAAVADRL